MKLFKKQQLNERQKINRTIGATLIYFLIFQISALVMMVVLKKYAGFSNGLLHRSGLPYLVAIALGFLFVMIISSKKDWRQYVQPGQQKMKLKIFISLLLVLMTGQIVASLLGQLLEVIFRLFGLSVLQQLETATQHSQSWSMLLYAALLGPLMEELVFRGVVLRRFSQVNYRLAIIASAYLFGLYHTNFVQSPFAFLIGLVLGYTALTYGIFWSLALHIFNNFILGDFMYFILQSLPPLVASEISGAILMLGGIAGLVVLLYFRPQIQRWMDLHQMPSPVLRNFFTNKLLITVTLAVVVLASLSLSTV
ncbi:CAAX amino protease [Liquorilactobacillus ghanensis DSM 18630]|uniref:CAAX amino protease n=1 Tax=Liquorilactobacillus ghanensis DSM 18630 TaxID=1423750 RepID=A0A0R1VIV0_9LACO|nr:type II CAAX endopeptidase family protein [Liquorilactobacillus ghanensis]KRM05678.1 CAAX amino protease [Liquorilactobacillus ghanensis DSM 18630]